MRFLFAVFLFMVAHAEMLPPAGSHTCTITTNRTRTETQKVAVLREYEVQETCYLFFTCTVKKHRTEMVDMEVPVVEKHEKIVCCEGYTQIGMECKPICDPPCRVGACVAPNTCECSSGYDGKSCVPACSRGTWGPECENQCECKNGANCNPSNGKCICGHGYVGELCGERLEDMYQVAVTVPSSKEETTIGQDTVHTEPQDQTTGTSETTTATDSSKIGSQAAEMDGPAPK